MKENISLKILLDLNTDISIGSTINWVGDETQFIKAINESFRKDKKYIKGIIKTMVTELIDLANMIDVNIRRQIITPTNPKPKTRRTQTKSKTTKLNSIILELHNVIFDLQSELAKIKDELITTKAELTATKEELAATKAELAIAKEEIVQLKAENIWLRNRVIYLENKYENSIHVEIGSDY